MQKSELRKLRKLNATKEMMEKAAVNDRETEGTDRWGTKKIFSRVYGIFMRIQYLNGYLKIAVFLPRIMQKGISTPKYEIFLNPEGNEYITRELDEQGNETGWRSAMADNLPEMNWWKIRGCRETAYINADGNRSIKRYLKQEKGGFDGIVQYQRKCRKQKMKEAEDRQTRPWDEDMKLVPEAPKAFLDWMKKEVPSENFIFYKYRRGGAEEGYCTYCRKNVRLAAVPKHRKEGACPVCKKKIQYISSGKLHDLRAGTDRGQLIQKVGGGFLVREFKVSKEHCTEEPKKTKEWIRETHRWFYRNGVMDHYSYSLYKNKYERWCKEPYCGYFDGKCMIYKKNLRWIEGEISKRSALHIIIKENVNISVIKYLTYEEGNPAVEKLVKIGMIRLAMDLIKVAYRKELMDQDQTEIAKLLKIDRGRLKRLKSFDSGINGLLWMQQEKKDNTEYGDDLIEYFDKAEVEPKDLDFLKKKISYRKIQNYITRQQEKTGETAMQTIVTWRDYLNMAGRAKMRTNLEQIFKPADLKKAHAEVVEILNREGMRKQAGKIEKKFPKVNKVCKTLGKYEWSDGEYIVRAPGGIVDIVREGTILRHCVHTCDYYFDRISNREAYLLFLRRAGSPETPWYTLEVEPGGNIRQKRTTGDNQNEDLQKAVGFLKKWQKVIQKRLSEEDRELARESEKKRQENYENLRKNGNLIWHGRLQGKLLADVLEQDFMGVI